MSLVGQVTSPRGCKYQGIQLHLLVHCPGTCPRQRAPADKMIAAALAAVDCNSLSGPLGRFKALHVSRPRKPERGWRLVNKDVVRMFLTLMV